MVRFFFVRAAFRVARRIFHTYGELPYGPCGTQLPKQRCIVVENRFWAATASKKVICEIIAVKEGNYKG